MQGKATDEAVLWESGGESWTTATKGEFSDLMGWKLLGDLTILFLFQLINFVVF